MKSEKFRVIGNCDLGKDIQTAVEQICTDHNVPFPKSTIQSMKHILLWTLAYKNFEVSGEMAKRNISYWVMGE